MHCIALCQKGCILLLDSHHILYRNVQMPYSCTLAVESGCSVDHTRASQLESCHVSEDRESLIHSIPVMSDTGFATSTVTSPSTDVYIYSTTSHSAESLCLENFPESLLTTCEAVQINSFRTFFFIILITTRCAHEHAYSTVKAKESYWLPGGSGRECDQCW